jgi:hypothetical protein
MKTTLLDYLEMRDTSLTISYKNLRFFLILAIVGSLTVFDKAWASFSSQPFFPIESGDFWTYRVDDGSSFTTTVLAGTTNVNGILTKALQSDGGLIDYFTNDNDGIRLHRQFDPDFGLTATFSPPIKFAHADTDIGQTVNSSGTVVTNFGNLSYSASYTVQAFENITVPIGNFTALRLQGTITLCSGSICETATSTLYLVMNIGLVKEIAVSDVDNYTQELTATNLIPPQSSLVAAVLPSSRSVQLGTTATAFATIINAGSAMATSCGISVITSVPANFTFQTTNPATNEITGTPNTPVDIPAHRLQTYVFAFAPTGLFAPTDVQFSFDCADTDPAPINVGLNTLLLSVSATPVPDIVALAATTTNNGIVNISGPSGSGAFAVATVNVGATGIITASADTASATLPVNISLCQTNPATGQCISAIDNTVTTTINANATPTFGIFVQGNGNVPFNPVANRIFVRFKDGGGVTRGSTSVAVTTE